MGKKKKVIIAYPSMMIGGSTTSLLSILNRLDYSKYDVDLLLNSHTGELLDKIPPQVNLLPPALRYTDKKKELIHRLLSPRYLLHYAVSKFIIRRDKVAIHGPQYLEMKDVEFFREIPDIYDVAIAFLEGDRCKFVARHINANRKLAWIHINYSDGKFEPKYDREAMSAFDRVALVSQDCKAAYDKAFPELAERSLVVENILSTEYVRSLAADRVDFKTDKNKINLVTLCRISFKSKGLDRAVVALSALKRERLINNLVWYIIGNGDDYKKLQEMITAEGLQENIVLLGMQNNPYKYMKYMDMFFLPSRWEGKPMAVTEAFMVGLPVLATEYSSAREQIQCYKDGIVVENSTDGIYKGLKAVAQGEISIQEMKGNVLANDYSNIEEIKKIEQLIDGDL